MVHSKKELNTEIAKCTEDTEKDELGGCEDVGGEFQIGFAVLAASAKAEFSNAIFVMESWQHRR
jgi:hypothetical protein